MIKEYIRFIREYFKLAEIKKSYVIVTFVSAFFYKGFLLLLPLVASLIVKYLMIPDANATFFYLGVLVVTYALYNITRYINFKVYGRSMSYCFDKLQTKILNKLSTVDGNFTRLIPKGRLMNSVNGDVVHIGDMSDRISEMVTSAVQILGVFVVVAFYNIFLALLLAAFSLAYIVVRNATDRKVNIYHKKVVTQDDKYSNLLTQIIAGLQEIKTFNMLPKLVNKLNTIQGKFIKDYRMKRKYCTIRNNDVKAISYSFKSILFVILILLVANGNIGINVLILVIMYFDYITGQFIENLISSTATIREVNVSVNRVNDILNYDSEAVTFGNLDTVDIYGSVEFKGVSLKIKEHEILKNINLKVDHNQVIAITGEAGSGKTMMFNLMLRLLKPTRGTIKIDDTNILDFSQEAYPKNISIVNQRPFIFNMSIRKNLDFADTNIENQIEACKRAGIHDFIMTLPNGYNTVLREDAKNISGGQKQMISIARTILTGSEVLLLDDVTTSLDPDTAKLVPKLVEDLKTDHTIIMITKKPDLMECADRIIVLEEGKIVGDGSHSKLIKTSEAYRAFHSRKSPSKVGVFDNV
jgi:ABC-type bacteriocin/lantibiotic exporter with double-glycine peptidase domain